MPHLSSTPPTDNRLISPDNRVISGDNSTDNTPDNSQFITLGLLAKMFDEQEITIRRAFKKLIKQGKLIETKDFIKANFLNARNFTYKLNPDKFIELVKQSDITTYNRPDINLISLKEKYLQKQAKTQQQNNHQTDITPDNSQLSTDISVISPDNTTDNSQNKKGLKRKQKTDISTDNKVISVDISQQEIIKILKESHQRIEENTKERINDLKEIIKKTEAELKEKNLQIGKHQKSEMVYRKEIQDLNRRLEHKDKELEQANGRVLYLQQQIYQLEQPKAEIKPKKKKWWFGRKG